MKQFFDTDWWKNTTGCTVGTIIGILLTFGTSFHLENRNKAEMARKTVLLTLHNLDASTRNMQTLLDELQQYDTLFTRPLLLCPTAWERWETTRCEYSSTPSAHADC